MTGTVVHYLSQMAPTPCASNRNFCDVAAADNLPYEKVGKNEPVCIADEVPFEIPESWEWVRLKNIAVTELGKTLDKEKNQGDYKPYLCSINVYWTGIDLSTIKEARFEERELSKYKLKKGDLLICEGGDVGRSAIWENEQEMYYQNALHRVRFYGGINPYYFKLLLECYKGNKILDERSKGMTIKHLVQSALNAIYFPLPPIQEQQRIVDKFQSLLPLLECYNTIEINLSSLNNRFPDLLKKSILQEAIQGKLVPQDPSDEPASVLLERIRAEKERLIQEGKIKRDKHESVIFRRDNSHYEKLDGIERCIDNEIPFEIPKSWYWVRFGQLYALTNGTASRGSKEGNNHPVLRLADLSNDIIASSNIRNICLPEKEFKTHMLQMDDLIFIRVNGSKDRVASAFHYTSNEIISFCDHLFCGRKYSSQINADYIMFVFNCPFIRKQLISEIKTTAGQNTISQTSMLKILLPLPPLSEQIRIVDEVKHIITKIKYL